MSFPEYLKERISEDYKNLIIQKLEEIKTQTDELKNSVAPTVFQSNQTLKDMVQREMARILEVLDNEFAESQAKFDDHLTGALEEYQSAWYHSDISRFQQQLEILISDIISNVPPPPPPPTPPKTENNDLVSLADLARKLDAGNTQSEILNIVLQQISGWADRAVLFVVKGDQATGWAAFGLGDDWDTNRVRGIRVGLGKDNVLGSVVRAGQPASGSADQFADNSEMFSILGNNWPSTVLACPVMVRGKIAGILYADLQNAMSEQPDVHNLIFLAARMAANAIDLLPMRPKPAPGAPAAAPVPAPPARPAVPAMTTAPAAPPAPAPAPAPPPPVEEEEEHGSTVMMTPSAPVAEDLKSMVGAAVVEEEVTGTVMMPAMKPPEIEPQDQKLHEDAKRFARLLVSEIKLYNEAQVSAGRENRDIYERLKEDIERSRKMYMERVPQHIHTTTNYFYEELVRTLANGDPTLLGM